MGSAPRTGDLVTVAPHPLPELKTRCGRFHAVVAGPARVTPGLWQVQQMRPAGGRWAAGASVLVTEDAIGPCDAQLDLFGNPVEVDRA